MTCPIVLARDGAHGPVVHDVNRAAAMLGLKPDARITDMRTLVPELRVEDADIARDTADLATIAHWARRWCPWTQTDGSDGLFLDTTGSDHLHGGEAAMQAGMREAFARFGMTARTACAPTPGAAYALARFARTGACVHPETLEENLSPLPVKALRLDQATITLLHRLGVKTIGGLAALPRQALVRRFRHHKGQSANPVRRLDQAMGREAEPLVAVSEHIPMRVFRRLLEPVCTSDALLQVLKALVEDLCHRMELQDCGMREVCFTLYRVDGCPLEVYSTAGSATRDPAHILRLFDRRFETLDIGLGIEAATLEATSSEPLTRHQDRLDGPAGEDMAVQQLIDRLAARLGHSAVRLPVLCPSHIPERASVLVSMTDIRQAHRHAVDRGMRLPLRMLNVPERAQVIHAVPDGPPVQIVWRRQVHRIVRSEGPERIAPEWWHEGPGTRLRDYYRIEDTHGHRYWIFREGIVHDGRGGPPSWFVHGIDA